MFWSDKTTADHFGIYFWLKKKKKIDFLYLKVEKCTCYNYANSQKEKVPKEEKDVGVYTVYTLMNGDVCQANICRELSE